MEVRVAETLRWRGGGGEVGEVEARAAARAAVKVVGQVARAVASGGDCGAPPGARRR